MSLNYSNEALITLHMVDMTDAVRRLSLAFLLVLLVAGLAGHLVTPASPLTHANESICAFHTGFLAPEIPQPNAVAARVAVQPDLDISIAFCLGGKVSHPPTL